MLIPYSHDGKYLLGYIWKFVAGNWLYHKSASRRKSGSDVGVEMIMNRVNTHIHCVIFAHTHTHKRDDVTRNKK